jgi:preprotein translocase subunit YajC
LNILLVIVVLFVLFWALLIRPQRRRANQHRNLVDSLGPGDEIVSTGGLFGVVRSVDGEELHVEIADGLVVRMARRAVAGVVQHDEAPQAALPEGDEEAASEAAPDGDEPPDVS